MALSPDQIRIEIRQISLDHPGIYGPYGPVSCYFA
jgi:hypothetical protein